MIKPKSPVAEEKTYSDEIVNELMERDTRGVFGDYFYRGTAHQFQNIESFFHWTDVLEWSSTEK